MDLTKPSLPLEVSVIVTEKNDKPCIELRKITTNEDIIRAIISCAFHERPIMILPSFTNKMQSLSSLVDKGVLYYDADPLNPGYFFV